MIVQTIEGEKATVGSVSAIEDHQAKVNAKSDTSCQHCAGKSQSSVPVATVAVVVIVADKTCSSRYEESETKSNEEIFHKDRSCLTPEVIANDGCQDNDITTSGDDN